MQEQNDPRTDTRRVSVSRGTLVKVAEYLAARPWCEVHGLLAALNEEAQPLAEPATTEEPKTEGEQT